MFWHFLFICSLSCSLLRKSPKHTGHFVSLCSFCTCIKTASFVGNFFPHLLYIFLLLNICKNDQGSVYSSQTSSHILDISKHLAQHTTAHGHCRLSHLPYLSHSFYIWHMLFAFYMSWSVPSCRVLWERFSCIFCMFAHVWVSLPRKGNMQLSYLLLCKLVNQFEATKIFTDKFAFWTY